MVLCIIRQVRKEKNQFLNPLIEIKSERTGRLSPLSVVATVPGIVSVGLFKTLVLY